MVPALTEAEQDEGVDQARRLGGGIFMALVLACSLICLGGILAAPWLVRAFAFGFTDDPAQFALTVKLTRWMFPFVLFVSLVSWCEGLLNIRGHYFIPKAAPGLVSAGIVTAAMVATDLCCTAAEILVGGLLVGGLVHLLVCLPAVLKFWGPLSLNISCWKTSRFGRISTEMSKVIAIGIFAQLNIMVLRLLASLLPSGSVTQYWYANRVVDLSQGVIAVAVGSAMLPPISKAVAAGDWERFEQTFVDASRMAAVVLIPAAALLLVIPGPIVRTLFQHGEFSAQAAALTSHCLVAMVPFMLAVAGINIIKKPYFALERRDILLGVGALGLGLTLALGWWLALQLELGVEGLALALSASTGVQFLAYVLILHKTVGAKVGMGKLMGPLCRMGLAALPAAAAAWGICQLGDFEAGSGMNNVLVLVGGCGAAVPIYLAGAWILGVRDELQMVIRKLKRS
jgi:putative peptidoglycan lipid II flippase